MARLPKMHSRRWLVVLLLGAGAGATASRAGDDVLLIGAVVFFLMFPTTLIWQHWHAEDAERAAGEPRRGPGAALWWFRNDRIGRSRLVVLAAALVLVGVKAFTGWPERADIWSMLFFAGVAVFCDYLFWRGDLRKAGEPVPGGRG